jgi:hypothetical protein
MDIKEILAIEKSTCKVDQITVTNDKDNQINAEYISDKSENHLRKAEKCNAVIVNNNCSENYFRTATNETNVKSKKEISEKQHYAKCG